MFCPVLHTWASPGAALALLASPGREPRGQGAARRGDAPDAWKGDLDGKTLPSGKLT